MIPAIQSEIELNLFSLNLVNKIRKHTLTDFFSVLFLNSRKSDLVDVFVWLGPLVFWAFVNGGAPLISLICTCLSHLSSVILLYNENGREEEA